MCPLLRAATFLAVALGTTPASSKGNDCLAQTPPMGWRSWNQYGPNVSQSLMVRVFAGMVNRSRLDHYGVPTSLADLGYTDVGLDDAWQLCNSSRTAEGMHYHDVYGRPIVNATRFPNLRDMTDHAHTLNLTAGFYGNNCICSDKCRTEDECVMQTKADTEAFLQWGFDSWKLDGCGGQNDLALFDRFLKEMSPDKPILVENCHWGNPDYDPKPDWCPFNYYRSSGDIGLSYGSVLSNLASVEKYRKTNASVPGCWAYPDGLQVGVRRKDDGEIGLSDAEARTHFGAWCIVSSPLILGHDIYDDEVARRVWDILSNRVAIAINQAYYGDSGGVYETSPPTVFLANPLASSNAPNIEGSTVEVPSYQYLSKPLSKYKAAVLLMNSAEEATTLTAVFEDIPGWPPTAKGVHIMCGMFGCTGTKARTWKSLGQPRLKGTTVHSSWWCVHIICREAKR
ncbi:hypothetical protein ACHAXT_012443 [Thalassiosira profunda]